MSSSAFKSALISSLPAISSRGPANLKKIPGSPLLLVWSLEVSGIIAEVAEEAENGLSYCNLSSGSFLGDEPPTLKFRALLTVGNAKVHFHRESKAGQSEPYA